MEITNEIKAKVFAQYLGERITIGDKDTYESLVGIKGINSIYTGVNPIGVDKWYKISACKLILKPLSAISDEDLLYAALIFDKTATLDLVRQHREGIIKQVLLYESKDNENSVLKCAFFCQFLQSKGYDLPQYLLNGQTLKEAGLAIYE